MIDLERLLMLARDELTEDDAAAVEEHVLECGVCASTLEVLLRLAPSMRDVVRSGGASFPVTPALTEELRAQGLISRTYVLAPERVVPCTVTAADVYTLTTLEADLTGVERVDLVLTLPMGPVRMDDVPFDRASGAVSYVTEGSRLRTLPSGRITIDLVSKEGSAERNIGRYLLEHTAFAGA